MPEGAETQLKSFPDHRVSYLNVSSQIVTPRVGVAEAGVGVCRGGSGDPSGGLMDVTVAQRSVNADPHAAVGETGGGELV